MSACPCEVKKAVLLSECEGALELVIGEVAKLDQREQESVLRVITLYLEVATLGPVTFWNDPNYGFRAIPTRLHENDPFYNAVQELKKTALHSPQLIGVMVDRLHGRK